MPYARLQQPVVTNWYSKRSAEFFLIALVFAASAVALLVPPFQSPDEFNHVKRAYLLSKGQIFILTVGNQTGGNIDAGLLSFMDVFQTIPHYKDKATSKMLRDSGTIAWKGAEKFSPLPNTAVYFPLSYLPQATALFIGRHSRLSVSDTYYLARTFSLAAAIALLWFALTLHPVPLPVLALFTTPMVLFQLGSASLDAISFAMCVLTGALFMRATDVRFGFTRSMHLAFIFSLLLLLTARTNLVGLMWIPMILYSVRRSRSYLISSGVLVLLCLSWIAYAALTVKGTQIQEISPADILLYYSKNIAALCSVMFTTLTNGSLWVGYWRMFIGVLGWLDTPLDPNVYSIFAVIFVAIVIVSIPLDAKILMDRSRLSLVLGTLFSTVLLFILFLATYTLHPAEFVDAIQGRYFYPVGIFLGFAVFPTCLSRNRTRIGIAIIFSSLLISVVSTVPKLLGRYWMS